MSCRLVALQEQRGHPPLGLGGDRRDRGIRRPRHGARQAVTLEKDTQKPSASRTSLAKARGGDEPAQPSQSSGERCLRGAWQTRVAQELCVLVLRAGPVGWGQGYLCWSHCMVPKPQSLSPYAPATCRFAEPFPSHTWYGASSLNLKFWVFPPKSRALPIPASTESWHSGAAHPDSPYDPHNS